MELGVKDGENGFILPFEMDNIDIQKIYKSRLKFNYTPPKDIYDKLLEGKSTYSFNEVKNVKVKCIKDYCDSYTQETKTTMSEPYVLNHSRALFLQEKGFVKIL